MDRIKSLLPSRHGYTRSRVDSDLSFTDARPPNFAVPLTPPPNQIFSLAGAGQASGAGYGHGSEAGPSSSTGLSTGFGSHRRVGSGGGPVRMNASEQARLQGLMRRERTASLLSVGGSVRGIGEGEMGRGGIQGRWEKLQVWMVNEGSRRLFVFMMILLQLLVFGLGLVHYHTKDNLTNANRNLGVTYSIARAAALVLHVDAAIILLPVCRSFISFLRRGPLNWIIPFEKNVTFHKSVAWSIVFWTAVHTLAHVVNVYHLALIYSSTTKGRVLAYFDMLFFVGPTATGWIMVLCLTAMVWTSLDKNKKKNFERFWYTHHLFIIFFINWQFHGMFCMIKPDRPPFCSANQIGVFWKYWLVGGLIYVFERIRREVRARHRTFISKVILHPNKVCEIQIKKEKTTTRAGQYVFLNCPEVSYWQWHPFTLTSAPEEDYISVHVRIVGDFTTALAESLGCELRRPSEKGGGGAEVVQPPLNRVLPRVMIDGPFGSASEDVFQYEVSVLVGAGIGVTPFASILKSIWYRLNYPQGKVTRLRKVYFFWICRDYDQFEWFQSLLVAIEEQDVDHCIEIHTYLTAKIKVEDINNIVNNDVGGERDTVTNLRAPTHYGRPNWAKIFQSIADKHPATEAGVFFCGPKVLGHTLHLQCNASTDMREQGTQFVWGKENF